MKAIIITGLALAAVCATVLSKDVRDTSGKKMVCYYGTWAVYRPGNGKFDVEDIDPNLCTHVVYGFAKLQDNVIKSFDPWQDIKDNYGGGKGAYLRFTKLKEVNPNLKTLIAIGGWNEGSEKYSDMASSPMTRKIFIDSIVPFLEKYNFDGLDLDWEYPTKRGGKPEDRENFAHLVTELRRTMPKKYLLTAAVSPNIETVADGYDVPTVVQNLDFINVMCYDYHGAWNTYTGHNTPLYESPLDRDHEPDFNVNDTVTYWLNAGLPKEKLILGMALYGRGFELENPSNNGLYAPAPKGLPQGPYTRQDGIWGYNEICEVFSREKDQWKIVIDPYVKAPYAYNGKLWIGYEDVESLYYKAQYAREMDVGGAMVWSIETDDFRGLCHGQKYIMINTIKAAMSGGPLPTIPDRPEIVHRDQSNEVPTSGQPSEVEVTPSTPTPRPRPPVSDILIPKPTTTQRPISSGSDECTQAGIIPSSTDCAAYITCEPTGNGTFRKHYQKCSPGLAFDPQIQGCNWASAVPGCDSNGVVADFYRSKSQ